MRLPVIEIVSDADACWIALVQDHTNCIATEPGAANAHLIAAAPDLLVACKEIERWWVEEMHWQDGAPVGSMFLLRAAIAKAEGR
jgi:hypothetical protein